MSVPQQRRSSEPGWCAKTDHRTGGGIRQHVSDPVRVGNQHHHGQWTAWLIQGNQGPVRVLVNVAHAASASVDVSLEEAVAFWEQLGGLLRDAGVDLD